MFKCMLTSVFAMSLLFQSSLTCVVTRCKPVPPRPSARSLTPKRKISVSQALRTDPMVHSIFFSSSFTKSAGAFTLRRFMDFSMVSTTAFRWLSFCSRPALVTFTSFISRTKRTILIPTPPATSAIWRALTKAERGSIIASRLTPQLRWFWSLD